MVAGARVEAEVDADAVTLWSARDRTRCWGPDDKKYLDVKSATTGGAREKAAFKKKTSWTRDYSFDVLQLTTPCGRIAAMHAGGDPERKSISERPSRTDQGSAKMRGQRSLAAMHQALRRACGLGPASEKETRKGTPQLQAGTLL